MLLQWRRLIALATALMLALTSLPLPVWASSVPLSRATTESAHSLDLSSLTVPEELGYVIETWQPTDQPPKGVIIHLQDAHANSQAQQHLSELIGYLHAQLGIEQIALEGATGPLDATLFSDFPDPSTTQRLATLFREEGLFTGAEEYAITHPGSVTLQGVEDEALYREHLAVWQQAQASRAAVEPALARLREALVAQRAALYPPELPHLLELRRAYDQDEHEGALRAYVQALVRLGDATNLEDATPASVRIFAEHGTLAPDAISGFLHELDTLQQQVQQALLTTETQRTLAELLQRVELVDALVHARLSPDEYRTFKEITKHQIPNSKQAPITKHQSPNEIDAVLASLPVFEQFYALALQRDAALVRQTLALLAQGSRLKAQGNSFLEPRTSNLEPNALILVAGGFHTPGITAALKAQRIAYAVITPRIDQASDEGRYHEGLANALPPLEEILAHVRPASLQIPLALDPHSPRHQDTFFYWTTAQLTALKGWGERLLNWFAAYRAKHPEVISYDDRVLAMIAETGGVGMRRRHRRINLSDFRTISGTISGSG